KLIFWDGTGVCLFAKRLEDGEFRWPKVQDGVMRLSAAELSALLEGLDWRRVHAAREIAHRRSRVDVRQSESAPTNSSRRITIHDSIAPCPSRRTRFPMIPTR